jgi:hypothetical protein
MFCVWMCSCFYAQAVKWGRARRKLRRLLIYDRRRSDAQTGRRVTRYFHGRGSRGRARRVSKPTNLSDVRIGIDVTTTQVFYATNVTPVRIATMKIHVVNIKKSATHIARCANRWAIPETNGVITAPRYKISWVSIRRTIRITPLIFPTASPKFKANATRKQTLVIRIANDRHLHVGIISIIARRLLHP